MDNSTDREAGDFGTVEAWKRWGSAAKAWYVRGQEAEFTEAMDRIVGPDAIGVPETLKVSHSLPPGSQLPGELIF